MNLEERLASIVSALEAVGNSPSLGSRCCGTATRRGRGGLQLVSGLAVVHDALGYVSHRRPQFDAWPTRPRLVTGPGGDDEKADG